MGFYTYFRIAKYYCPRNLRPFAPVIYYEVARQLETYAYLSDYFYMNEKMRERLYQEAYDRVVERIGEKIAKENYLRKAEKNVSHRDQQSGHKERESSGDVAPV